MSERNRPAREPQAEADGVIEGRNAVTEALRAGTVIDKIYHCPRGRPTPPWATSPPPPGPRGIVVVDADRRKLDAHEPSPTPIRASSPCAAVREYASVDDILAAAREKGEAPLIVVCDELSDPHNLGAVIRTACVRGRPRRHHPQAPLRRPHRRGGQDLCRRRQPHPRGPGAQHHRPAQAAQGGGRLDLRHRA